MKARARQLIRELVDVVLSDREDARVLRPVLKVMVETAVRDFERYYDVRHAHNRVRDFDILMARERAKKRGERRDNEQAGA